MDLNCDIHHKFDLTGLPAGTKFQGCKKCWYMLVDGYAVSCPNCSRPNYNQGLWIFTVTKEDVEKLKV